MKNMILFTFVLLSFLSSCKVMAMEEDDPKNVPSGSSSRIVLDITDTRFAKELLAVQRERNDKEKLKKNSSLVLRRVDEKRFKIVGCHSPFFYIGLESKTFESLSTDELSKKRRRDAFRYGIGVEIRARDLPEKIYYRTSTSCIVPTSPSEENLKSSLGRAEDARDKEKEKEN
ncbi:MAG: hypothetical protein BGO67_00965 [Alphaproteobacteria bacterium 41-28]|nr:MAG: hypothetical protein BGO67_00965 [Alphaproteobacteria bacterium 41-28]